MRDWKDINDMAAKICERIANLPPRCRNTDPETSREAADNAPIGEQCTDVLIALRQHPGVSSRRLAELSGLDRHTVGRRFSELRLKGLAHKRLDPFTGKASRDEYGERVWPGSGIGQGELFGGGE